MWHQRGGPAPFIAEAQRANGEPVTRDHFDFGSGEVAIAMLGGGDRQPRPVL